MDTYNSSAAQINASNSEIWEHLKSKNKEVSFCQCLFNIYAIEWICLIKYLIRRVRVMCIKTYSWLNTDAASFGNNRKDEDYTAQTISLGGICACLKPYWEQNEKLARGTQI